MATSTVENHGSGAQTLHSGRGDQSINTGPGVLLNVDKYVAIHGAEAPIDLVRSLLSQQEIHSSGPVPGNTRSAQSPTTQIISWLKSLSPMDFHDRLSFFLKQMTPGTGEWLLKNEKFLSWKNGKDRILWLDGIIGAGKSILASFIIDNLQREFISVKNECVCVYIFFGFGDQQESQPKTEVLLASILTQLLMKRQIKELPTEAVEIFKDIVSRESSPLFEELKDLMESIAQTYQSVYLIVDALDDCSNHLDPGIQETFIKTILRLPENWKVLVTSRSGVLIGHQFKADLMIKLEADPVDIKLYVEHRIKTNEQMLRLVSMEKSAAFQEEIVKAITEKTQGIFLLAKMHMDYLAAQGTLGHFKTALGRLPEGRIKTFDAALQRIMDHTDFEIKLATHVISWVLSAARDLRADEVRHAFAVQPQEGTFNVDYLPDEDRLTSVCAGLIVVDQDTKVIRPVHDSVLPQLRSFTLIPAEPERHQDVALRCLVYLGQVRSSTGSISERIRNHPLLEYAAMHWFRHAMRAAQTPVLEKQLVKFLRNTSKLSASFQVRDDTFPNSITGLHAAAYFDMAGWADLLLRNGAQANKYVNSPCSNGQTPLHWASHFNRIDLARKLIVRYGADINALDDEGNTPLHLAVEGQHVEMVRLLLEHNAIPDIGNRKGWTPFRWAVRYGCLSVARPLAERKVEIDVRNTQLGTPFFWAVVLGRLDLVELLLQNGWEVNWMNQDGWTALRHAAQFGNERMARLLLAYKANVDIRDGYGSFTPLRWAVNYGKTAVARILLEACADVNATCKDGYTPLMEASRRGDKGIVWHLIDHGARLDEQGKNGATALHLAVHSRSKSVTWLLVENGAKIDLPDQDGMTALHRAVIAGDTALVWYLLEKGADLSLVNNYGRDCLHLAAQLGHDRILGLFLERGMETTRQDKKGKTALHYATQGGADRKAGMVVAMVERGTNVNVQDHRGLTPLHLAASQGYGDTVEALVKGHADPNIQDKEGFTALHHAVWGGPNATNIMVKLLKAKANLDVQDQGGKTALMHAAQRGDGLAALCLVNNGADSGVKDKEQWTARDYAVKGKHDLIEALLSGKVSNQGLVTGG